MSATTDLKTTGLTKNQLKIRLLRKVREDRYSTNRRYDFTTIEDCSNDVTMLRRLDRYYTGEGEENIGRLVVVRDAMIEADVDVNDEQAFELLAAFALLPEAEDIDVEDLSLLIPLVLSRPNDSYLIAALVDSGRAVDVEFIRIALDESNIPLLAGAV